MTTFFVQSLTGLSQDTGARTNELLQNFTDIYIAVNGVNVSQLDFSQPVPFEPESSAVRLNFYWSIALVLSVGCLYLLLCSCDVDHDISSPQISVAALAVISRGYIAMLSRSKHRAAHKKLGDLVRRWNQAEKLLKPAIEVLPQLLIVPVLLFVVGLLDNILSSATPLLPPFVPIFAAGLLSCLFALVVASYTIWTVVHGVLHPETSPFQSTLSKLMAAHSADLYKAVKQRLNVLIGLWNSVWLYLLGSLNSPTSTKHNLDGMELGSSDQELTSPNQQTADTGLAPHEIHAFHSTLQQTHEDNIVDQAVTVFKSVVQQQQFACEIPQDEFVSLCYLLSDEASIRTNITVAQFISSSAPCKLSFWPTSYTGFNNDYFFRFVLQALSVCAVA